MKALEDQSQEGEGAIEVGLGRRRAKVAERVALESEGGGEGEM